MPRIDTEIDLKDVSVSIEVEVFCATCGKGLCNQSTATKTRNRHADAIDVEACQNCLSNAEDAGYEKGYEAARKEFEENRPLMI
jgi:hypothetical protein